MNKKRTAAPITPESLEKQAQESLESGKYKKASELYKKLLQLSGNEQWHGPLAYCYVQRAVALAEKGMFKEAVVLWDNHCQYARAPYDAYDQYITWLILSKNKAGIQKNLQQLSIQQVDKDYPGLASLLGLLALTESPEIINDLPQESAFVAHYHLIKTAVQAYEQKDEVKLTELLKQIPYRSAFRDLRSLLQALLVLPGSEIQVQALLARVSADSAYASVVRLLEATLLEGAELFDALLGLNYSQRNIINHIKGFNKQQCEFLEHLMRQHEHLSDKVKFNIAIQYQSLLGAGVAQNYCQQLLSVYSAGHKDFKKNFGAADEYEENRVSALLCEREGNIYDAEYHWRLCVKALYDPNKPENDLKIAMILRHLSRREEPREQTDLLIESLQYDAEDRDIYLQILDFYQQSEAAKDYKQWLAKTLEKFPQDIDVLARAVQEATANKTYKKASQYANKILKIDPLNTFAKQTLFASHLAHTRRLMRERSYPLVGKEIKRLEALNIGKAYAKKTQLIRAFFCFAHEDKEQGLQLIADAFAQLYADPVNGHFHASWEALSMGLPVATVLRVLPAAKDHLLSVSEFAQFLQLLEQLALESDNEAQIHKALEKIKGPLKKSLTEQEYDEAVLLNLCKVLEKLQHFELLRHCSKLAFDQWKKPIWMYYRVYANNNGKPEDCEFREVMSLQHYHEQAMQNKDFQVGILLEKLLDRYYQAHPQRSMGFLDNLFGMGDEEEEDVDLMESLFGDIPDAVLMDLNKTIESLSKETSIDQVVLEIMETMGNDENIMLAIMQDPDLFSALMVVKSAEKLGINIDVSIQDVLDCFGVGKNAPSFSF